jgi:MFS transporter, putative signal transducer
VRATVGRGQKGMPDLRLMLVLLGLYVSQSIPLYLFSAALPAILREIGVSRTSIGLLSILALPWIVKFLWAPLVDRHALWQPLGRRRSWIIPLQASIIVFVLLLAQFPPAENMAALFVIGALIAVLSATQDAAADGYAVERLAPAERGIGNAIQGGAVAVGVIAGGAGTLLLYDRIGWEGALTIIGFLAFLAALPLALMQEDETQGETAAPRASLRNFFARADARGALAFCLLYRGSEGLVKGMEQPFLVDSDLSLSAVGLVSGGSAATVGLVGSVLAAIVIRNVGLRPCLWGLSLGRTVIYAGFTLFAAFQLGGTVTLIGLALLHTLSRYMEIVALYSLFMGLCSRHQAATDFTLLSCAQLLVYMGGAMVSGMVADAVGYANLFAIGTALSLAGIMLAMRQIPADHLAFKLYRGERKVSIE